MEEPKIAETNINFDTKISNVSSSSTESKKVIKERVRFRNNEDISKDAEIQIEDDDKNGKGESESKNKESIFKCFSFRREKNRDPNNINEHVKLGWSSLFAEPEDIRSLSFGWKIARGIFVFTETLLYVLLNILLSPILAFAFAIIAASLAFLHIWVWTPTVKICNTLCEAVLCLGKMRACFEFIGNCYKPKTDQIVSEAPDASGGDVTIDVPIVDQPV